MFPWVIRGHEDLVYQYYAGKGMLTNMTIVH